MFVAAAAVRNRERQNTAATEARRPDEWGAIGISAWGLSRALDVLKEDPEIDAAPPIQMGYAASANR